MNYSMKQLILHIPHASTHIPDKTAYRVSDKVLQAEILKLTDWHTDELFANTIDHIVQAPFSRVFCDVERFADDRREPMAKHGMGVLYQALDDGRPLRRLYPGYRQKVIRDYYLPHHNRLTRMVQDELDRHGHCLIVDAHSFPDAPLKRDPDQSVPRPDFCIGTDPFHTPPGLAERAAAFFRERGYTTEIDRPYKGALVPLSYYNKNPQVQALMLELNRKLYLRPGSSEKSEGFETIKSLIQEFLSRLRKELSSLTLNAEHSTLN